MKKLLMTVFLVFTGLVSLAARADVLVLVHGYLASAHSWDTNGVTAALQRHGWQRAGVFVGEPGGIRLIPAPGMRQFMTEPSLPILPLGNPRFRRQQDDGAPPAPHTRAYNLWGRTHFHSPARP